jgi:hypothetical protein
MLAAVPIGTQCWGRRWAFERCIHAARQLSMSWPLASRRPVAESQLTWTCMCTAVTEHFVALKINAHSDSFLGAMH